MALDGDLRQEERCPGGRHAHITSHPALTAPSATPAPAATAVPSLASPPPATSAPSARPVTASGAPANRFEQDGFAVVLGPGFQLRDAEDLWYIEVVIDASRHTDDGERIDRVARVGRLSAVMSPSALSARARSRSMGAKLTRCSSRRSRTSQARRSPSTSWRPRARRAPISWSCPPPRMPRPCSVRVVCLSFARSSSRSSCPDPAACHGQSDQRPAPRGVGCSPESSTLNPWCPTTRSQSCCSRPSSGGSRG